MRFIQPGTYFFLFIMAVLMVFMPVKAYAALGVIELPKTGQTNSYYAGDDGDLEIGVDWDPGTRFTDNSDGTITDGLTGLMWLQDANCASTVGFDPDGVPGNGQLLWGNAAEFIHRINGNNGGIPTLNLCTSTTYSNWRMPNIHEIETLVDSGYMEQDCTGSSGSNPCASLAEWLIEGGFVNVQIAGIATGLNALPTNGTYWASTIYIAFPESAWGIQMLDGDYRFLERDGQKDTKVNVQFYVLPVRCVNEVDGVCTGGTIEVAKTGLDDTQDNDNVDYLYCSNTSNNALNCPASSTNSWYVQQDGYQNKGVEWPYIGNTASGRFVDIGDGTMIDLLSGLQWLDTTECMRDNYAGFDTEGTPGDGFVTWETALDFIQGLNIGLYPLCNSSNSPFSDWRMGNRLELLSVTHYYAKPGTCCMYYLEQWLSYLPWSGINGEGFNMGEYDWATGLPNPSGFPRPLWTSTSYDTDSAYVYNAGLGRVMPRSKDSLFRIWPVRTAPDGFTLSVNILPAGTSNSVAKSPDQSFYPIIAPFTDVDLTAVPDTGYSFGTWQNCDSSTGAICTETVDGFENITATFLPLPIDSVVPFGNVNVGLSPTRTLTVNNISTSTPLDLGTITAPSLPFSIIDNCTAVSPLMPLASCDITVQFSPIVTGQANGSFSIAGVKTVALTGTGMNNTGQDIYVLPSEQSFLSTVTNSTSATETIEVRNVGGVNLDIGTIVVPTPPAGVFNFIENCTGETLVPYPAPGSTCTIDIVYDATGVGAAVDPFLVNFAVPSGLPNSDPDENSVNVGLFASVTAPGNILPIKPELSSPQNAAMNVNPFRLECDMCSTTTTDGDGQPVAYTVYYSTDPSFANSAIFAAADSGTDVMYAMAFSNPVFLIALFGILALGVFMKRKKITLIIVTVVFASSLLLIACSNHKDAGDGSSSGAGAGAGAQAGTYYWKIIADDGVGGSTESDTWSFKVD